VVVGYRLNRFRHMKVMMAITEAVLLVGFAMMLSPDLAIYDLIQKEDVEVVKQHLSASADVRVRPVLAFEPVEQLRLCMWRLIRIEGKSPNFS
jgi:hypothetical protein